MRKKILFSPTKKQKNVQRNRLLKELVPISIPT